MGEAYRDFQTQIKSLKNQGILLAIASKNDEATAIEAINKHPEMILSMDDFVEHRINWEDRFKNISEMVRELNLGLQSVVFLDDSPFERARVREELPEVLVPELPEDPTDYHSFFSRLRCFDKTHITEEDKVRGSLYKSESKRTKLKKQLKSFSEWVKTLNLNVIIENIKQENTPRAIQLLNKTNQMNLSTRRLSEKEFNTWVKNFVVPHRRSTKPGGGPPPQKMASPAIRFAIIPGGLRPPRPPKKRLRRRIAQGRSLGKEDHWEANLILD